MNVWHWHLSRLSPLLFIAGLAISCDHPKKRGLRELSKQGIEPSGQALLTAVTAGNSQHIEWLIVAGVTTEEKDAKGKTPIMLALENKDSSSFLKLLEAKANVNATTADRVSVLGIAVERSDDVVIDRLISAGARGHGLMPSGDEILPWAIRHDRAHIVDAIIKSGADPRAKDREGNSLLHIAMSSGQRKITESLIELGADPAGLNSIGETALHQAFRQNWLDLVPRLATAGADPNVRSADGLTLLDKAVADQNADQISLLIKVGANPNSRDPAGKVASPLLKTFNRGDAKLFQIFLEHQVLPPEKNWNSWLEKSFEIRQPEIARLLLKHGASASERRADGLYLVEAAVIAQEATFVKMLLESGNPAGNSLIMASAQGDLEMVNLLISGGQPVNQKHHSSGDTPLNAAIRAKHDPVAALLIEKGADTNSSLREGQSVLHLALATGCAQTVKTLLDAGADPNSPFIIPISEEFRECVSPGVIRWLFKNDSNITPLMMAADSGNVTMADHLIKAGAKIDARTAKTKMWPIDFACRREDVKMARLILGKNPHHEERRMEIRLSEQRARLFDAEGKEIFTTKVSTGRKGFATPQGVFVITHKNRDWTSTLYHASMPYFQRLSCRDFGLHQGNVPDYPASHGCIRVPAGNAQKLFTLTQSGDRVNIIP